MLWFERISADSCRVRKEGKRGPSRAAFVGRPALRAVPASGGESSARFVDVSASCPLSVRPAGQQARAGRALLRHFPRPPPAARARALSLCFSFGGCGGGRLPAAFSLRPFTRASGPAHASRPVVAPQLRHLLPASQAAPPRLARSPLMLSSPPCARLHRRCTQLEGKLGRANIPPSRQAEWERIMGPVWKARYGAALQPRNQQISCVCDGPTDPGCITPGGRRVAM